MKNWVSLHTHSTYSLVDGYGTPKQYFDRAELLGMSALGVSDHGNISAHFKWYKEGKKRGIKPILGCEMYIVEDLNDKTKREYNHITVIAKNNKGYENLIKLVTTSWLNGFYYKPRIDWSTLNFYKDGLIIASGCMSSRIGEIVKRGGALKEVKIELKRQKEMFGENYYAEITPLSFEEGKKYIQLVYKAANELSIPLVVTADCHYPESHQNKIQEILLCIQSNNVMSNDKRWKFSQDDFYLKSREEMEESFKKEYPDMDITEGLDNTLKIAYQIDFKFPEAHPLKFPLSEKDKVDTLKKMCWKGMKEKGLENNKEYINRVKYELDLIIKKDFIDYFLIIADLINYAKSSGILVGHARGSSAGSLVCYLTHITEVDPLVHGLIFERFIDINREDLPDIDIDFEDTKRDIVKQYLYDKYGENCVGDIATFGTFKGRMCIADIGRVYEIPYDVIAKINKVVLFRSSGDSRAGFTVKDTFENFEYPKESIKKYPELSYSLQLEGQVRNIGKHAAGVVISNESLENVCAFYQREGKKVISMDYYDVSSVGLLKIDLLGLSTLTYIKKTIDLVKERHKKTIDYYNIPIDDLKVYDLFNDPERLFGIFQFDGQAVNQVCRQVHPRTFKELADVTSLARPGALNGGSTTLYIMRKNGKQKITYSHPFMQKITEDTQGVVIYQEQVMRTMREIGNMNWKDTAEIRKNISKSRGIEAFNEYREKFSKGALENGLNQDQIKDIWDHIATYGAWGFNLAHAISYSYISYATAWLKVYYPLEYYVSILSTITKEETIKKVIKEFRREGYAILPIDINKSKETFSIDANGIRLGFTQIKGIGAKNASIIVNNQPYCSYVNFKHKLLGKRVNKKNIVLLEDLGAFNLLGGIIEEPTLFNQNPVAILKKEMTQDRIYDLCPFAVELNIESEWKLFMERYLVRYPEKIDVLVKEELTTGDAWDKPDRFIIGIAYDKNLRDKKEVAMSKGKKVDFKEGEPTEFINMLLEDDSDFITVRIGTKICSDYKKMIFEELGDRELIIIKGKVGSGIRMVFANAIASLEKLKYKIENNIELTYNEKIFIKPSINKFINI